QQAEKWDVHNFTMGFQRQVTDDAWEYLLLNGEESFNERGEPEMFREQVSLQVERGRKSSMNFRTAERFGLIEAVDKPVVFWFE
ncbi:YjfK family protein, partial [Salmonella enterica subsp. enterica serovar Anatum]|nr:YjfK family protein [Salmonella enterica subsp. enterica serovar Anatum]